MLTGEDKPLAKNVIDHHRGKNIRAKGIGGENTKAFDEKDHQHSTEKGTDAGDGVKEKNFDNKVIFASLKNPENVGDVSHHIGKKKSNAVTDH